MADLIIRTAGDLPIIDPTGVFDAGEVEAALLELQQGIPADATDVPIIDPSGVFDGGNVEEALLELAAASGGGGSALGSEYNTVVSNDSELAAALTSDSGATFIKPGAYTVDLDTLGTVDTTPRRFVGAGQPEDDTGPFGGNGVTIEITGTSIGDSLDMGAVESDVDGVVFENVMFVRSSALLGAIIEGLYGGKNLICEGLSLGTVHFRRCFNLVNCVAVNGDAGFSGFNDCHRLTNCQTGGTAGGVGAETGFVGCTDLVNCRTNFETGGIGSLPVGFFACERLSNCYVNASGVTSFGVSLNGFQFCNDLVNCYVEGPSGSVLGSSVGFNTCERMTGCYSEKMAINYSTCVRMANCESTFNAVGGGGFQHFVSCSDMQGCNVDGTGDGGTVDGFENCQRLVNCTASNNTGHGFDSCDHLTNCFTSDPTLDGYNNCRRLNGCFAGNAGDNGFENCDELSGCISDSNTGNGFDDCDRVTGCSSTTNTTGYVNCKHVSSSTSSGDGTPYSGSDTEDICPHSNSFQHIITPTQITTDEDDYTGLEHASFGRLDSDASRNVTGIAPGGASHVDRFLRIINVGSNDIVFQNQNAGSAAANRIITGTGADLTLGADGVLDLWYDTLAASGVGRWRVMQG